jgi:hypothetical protein
LFCGCVGYFLVDNIWKNSSFSKKGKDDHQNNDGITDQRKLILNIEIKEEIQNGINCMRSCRWLLIGTSCLFVTLLSWDIAGDQQGWHEASWVPMIGLGMMIVLWGIDSAIGVELILLPRRQ